MSAPTNSAVPPPPPPPALPDPVTHSSHPSPIHPRPQTTTSPFAASASFPPRPPSPSTTAAAISLGALAAAASLAAATDISPSSHQTPSSNPNTSQQPSSLPLSSTPITTTTTTTTASTTPTTYPPTYPRAYLPPTLQPHPVKPSATPVAPAPSSHPLPPPPPTTNQLPKPKQRRYRATPDQLRHLIARFELNPSPSTAELQELANSIAMPAQSAVLWFKNRRARVPHKKSSSSDITHPHSQSHTQSHSSPSNLNNNNNSNNHHLHNSPVNTHNASIPNVNHPVSNHSNSHSNHSHSNSTSTHSAARPTPPARVSASNKRPHPSVSTAAHPSAPAREAAAAASMAELALTTPSRRAGSNITNLGSPSLQNTPSPSLSSPRPSSSHPPQQHPHHRARGAHAMPYDISLVSRLSAAAAARNARADFVSASTDTPRRPRVIPPTPRLFQQREYGLGELVEVLETGKGICRAWYTATVVARAAPYSLSLGDNAAGSNGNGANGEGGKEEIGKMEDAMEEREKIHGNVSRDSHMATGVVSAHATSAVKRENEEEDNGGEKSGGDGAGRDVTTDASDGANSPRTVRSPAASPTPSVAKVRYVVEYEHRRDEKSGVRLVEEVLASRMRPEPPGSRGGEWRPEAGEAVEVLRDGAWFVSVIQNFVVRKGYMVSFESGDVMWVRRDALRPYQIWRGGGSWVTKTKPPLPVVRKSVGLSVTHPPGGKRKRGMTESDSGGTTGTGGSGSSGGNAGWGGGGGGGGGKGEMSRRSKRNKSLSMEGTGPDGLPEGWRMDYMKRSGFVGGKGQTFYIAPDGHRLKSLKEAQRYVRMMGPA